MEHTFTTRKPSECTNIAEVRNEIDNIDRTIVDLLSQRFQYVKEVVKYKDNTPSGIQAEDRRRAVLECRRAWAQEKGLSPDIIESIYDKLIQYFIEEEMKLINV